MGSRARAQARVPPGRRSARLGLGSHGTGVCFLCEAAHTHVSTSFTELRLDDSVSCFLQKHLRVLTAKLTFRPRVSWALISTRRRGSDPGGEALTPFHARWEAAGGPQTEDGWAWPNALSWTGELAEAAGPLGAGARPSVLAWLWLPACRVASAPQRTRLGADGRTSPKAASRRATEPAGRCQPQGGRGAPGELPRCPPAGSGAGGPTAADRLQGCSGDCWAPHRASDSAVSQGLRICISRAFPAGADATGVGTTFENSGLRR